MNVKKFIATSVFVASLVTTVVLMSQYSSWSRPSASVLKKSEEVKTTESLSKVSYNGEDMYVAKSTFYDYYSDSEVGTSSTPKEISDAKNENLNCFGQFNTKLMKLMKYNVESECPAQYPLYQGRHGFTFTPKDMNNFYKYKDEEFLKTSNYWIAANNCHFGSSATQGLVDNKLKYDSEGISYVTQSNPANGKTSFLPYFDKKFLTANKFDNSQLSLGSVKENVAFPFRKNEKDGITYYEFDAGIDTVRFNNNNQLDYFGTNNKKEQVLDVLSNPGLFPYNTNKDSNSNKLNFGYGVKIEIPFNMTSDGKINGKDMIFEFSGDDDVWVFIDGELALDIGGPHKKVEGYINFAKQIACVNSVKNNKVAFAKRDMRVYTEGLFTDNELKLINVPSVFKNKTDAFGQDLKTKLSKISEVHTLTLFYMERGMGESNMKIKFNLPEPTKYTVDNVVVEDSVSDTFKNEAIKVAKEDEFVYDVVDKTLTKALSLFIKGNDGVIFTNEFNTKDLLLTQQRTLRNASRKMIDLYDTSWILKDEKTEISKENSLIVSDTRLNDKGVILFNNVDEKNVPVLTTTYTNKIKVNDFVLSCKVSDEYAKDVKDKEFKYTVKHQSIFGGTSEEKLYSGKYILYNEDGKEEEKSTDNGIIILKAGQKAVIKNIPVVTIIKTSVEIGEKEEVIGLKTTEQFKYDKDKGIVEGAINKQSNIVEYSIGNKKEEVKEPDKFNDTEIKDITDKTDVTVSNEKDNVQPAAPNTNDELDDVAQTGDESSLVMWLILMGISIGLTLGAGISLVISKRK